MTALQALENVLAELNAPENFEINREGSQALQSYQLGVSGAFQAAIFTVKEQMERVKICNHLEKLEQENQI